MSVQAEVLTEFGRSLGIADFRWPASGMAVFEFDVRGTLYLEEQEDVLLVYLVQDIDLRERGPEILKTALRLCHYRENRPHVVQTGLRDPSKLIFLARLPLREVTLPELEQVLEMLTRLHERVRGG